MPKSKKSGCRHSWHIRRGGRFVYAHCGVCVAQVRLQLVETRSAWAVSSTVIGAGRGVSSGQLDRLSDRVYNWLVGVRPAGTTFLMMTPAA